MTTKHAPATPLPWKRAHNGLQQIIYTYGNAVMEPRWRSSYIGGGRRSSVRTWWLTLPAKKQTYPIGQPGKRIAVGDALRIAEKLLRDLGEL